MRWILYIFADLVRHVMDRKGRWWGIALILCGIGVCATYYLTFVPRDVAYPDARVAREYQQQLAYLMSALAESPPDFSGVRGRLYGSTIAVMDRKDFPLFTKKLRYHLHKAAADRFLFHVITVGGTEVRDIDQPLLNATRRLRLSAKPNIEIAIVAPSTISDQTKQILEKRGLRVRLIGAP
jgi:hypothetical protein